MWQRTTKLADGIGLPLIYCTRNWERFPPLGYEFDKWPLIGNIFVGVAAILGFVLGLLRQLLFWFERRYQYNHANASSEDHAFSDPAAAMVRLGLFLQMFVATCCMMSFEG
jgi:hypothetical protein